MFLHNMGQYQLDDHYIWWSSPGGGTSQHVCQAHWGEAYFLVIFVIFAFSALILLVVCQEEHPTCKKLRVCGDLSGAANDLHVPADVTATPLSLASLFRDLLSRTYAYHCVWNGTVGCISLHLTDQHHKHVCIYILVHLFLVVFTEP